MNYYTYNVLKVSILVDNLKQIFIQNKPFTTLEAAKVLERNIGQTSKILYKLGKQGHLYKIKKGLYLPIPHKGLTPEETFSDPWQLVPHVFPKGYVGGWSAATHWGLTEQLFRDVCILTIPPVHHKIMSFGRFDYILFSQNNAQENELEKILRGNNLVSVSDPHRTIIDMLNNPDCGGGIQHTIDCMKAYFSEYYDELIFVNRIRGNKGVFFKRLGYIVEVLFGANHPLSLIAKENISKGKSKIDSKMKCTKFISRWNLYINNELEL